MKQLILPAIVTFSVILLSCGSADKKTDPGETTIENKKDTGNTVPTPPVTDTVATIPTDTAATNSIPKTTVKKAKPNTAGKSGQSRGLTRGMPTEPGDILADIDEYLISKVEFKALPSGGFTNGIITLTNTLPDITFQKAIVEVIIQKQDGAEIRRAYYTVLNIEPGLSKVVKIPNSTQGSQLVTQVVKVKSNELTKGEWVLAGNHYVAN